MSSQQGTNRVKIVVAIIAAAATVAAAIIGLSQPIVAEWAKARLLVPTESAADSTRTPRAEPEPADATGLTDEPASAVVIEPGYFRIDPSALAEGTAPSGMGSNLLVMEDRSSGNNGITSMMGDGGQVQLNGLDLTSNFEIEYTADWWGWRTFLLQSSQGDVITLDWDHHGYVQLNDKEVPANRTLGEC